MIDVNGSDTRAVLILALEIRRLRRRGATYLRRPTVGTGADLARLAKTRPSSELYNFVVTGFVTVDFLADGF